MRHVVAREIMSRPAITIRPETPIRDIVNLMLRFGISGLPVVDAQGRLLGIVTEADVIHKEAEPSPSPPAIPWHGRSLWLERRVDRYRKAMGTTARDLMTENVVTAGEETSVRDLAHLMLSRGVNRVPIVTEGRVVGIVTRADILKVFVRSDEALVAAVRDALVHDLWIDPTHLTIACTGGVVTIAGKVDRRSDRDLAVKWIRSIDGVIGVEAGGLTFRIDDLALGRVVV
jgi:CBS domain-containing protein